MNTLHVSGKHNNFFCFFDIYISGAGTGPRGVCHLTFCKGLRSREGRGGGGTLCITYTQLCVIKFITHEFLFVIHAHVMLKVHCNG